MSGKAWALVGLKHAVAESVLLGQREVGLNIGWLDVHELRIGMGVGWVAARRRDQVRAVHFAAVVHGDKGGMGVAQVVVLRVSADCAQIDGTERDGLTQ